MRLTSCLAAAAAAVLTAAPAHAQLKGEIKADGSSTVYLITEAVAKAFKTEHAGVSITVGISGTGGGFKKFINNETDIQDASRPIKPEEAAQCKAKGIEYLELQVAWDGLAVVIHPENTWARKMTVAQLKKIWEPDSSVKKWSDVDPKWPNEPIKLFGAGPDSGTFDYFTEVIVGKEKAIRKDYEPSEDDQVLVKGVAGNKYAMGFFGVAYYESNTDKLAVVAVAEKEGGEYVLPTPDNVLNKTYKPLGRPLFIYVKTSALKRPEVQEFVRFFLRRDDLVASAKYIRTGVRIRSEQRDKFEAAVKALK